MLFPKVNAAMTVPRVLVLTCDKYQWCLRPFAYLFNTYWSSLQPVLVGCFSSVPFPLPDNFETYKIDRHDYPPGKWSNGLIRFLKSIPDEYIVLMLEDYWLCRTADVGAVPTLTEWMMQHPDVVRFDLTADRLYGQGMRDIGAYGHYDVIECDKDAPYQMSLQAAIWKRDLLLRLLRPDQSAWETEIHTDMTKVDMRVAGTRQYPVRYANGVLKGKLDSAQISLIPDPHKDVIGQWFPKE